MQIAFLLLHDFTEHKSNAEDYKVVLFLLKKKFTKWAWKNENCLEPLRCHTHMCMMSRLFFASFLWCETQGIFIMLHIIITEEM